MSKENRIFKFDVHLIDFTVQIIRIAEFLRKTNELHDSKFLVRYCPPDSPPCGRVHSFDIHCRSKSN